MTAVPHKEMELEDERTAQKQYRKVLQEKAKAPVAFSGPANLQWTGDGIPKFRKVADGDLVGRVALIRPDEDLLDGGIRRGSDVVKAVALGARAVMIGRAYLWGLAAGGQSGVENVLDILRGGIDSALLGLGLSSIDELSAADLVVPDGFRRDLGV